MKSPENDIYTQIQETAEFIRARSETKPDLAVILGTGMGSLAHDMAEASVIDYETIPHFPVSTVESHAGRLHVGSFHGVQTVMMQGRFHYYEGYSMQQVAFPVRVMHELGAKTLLVMNAVGSVNSLIPAGSLVLVQDHINLMGDNPLIGPNDDRLGPRFPDMSEPYSRELILQAESVALHEQIESVHRGVLVAVTGPCFETAAEYRMFQRMGADIVGMSTIPEVISASHLGMRVLCISTVTDECLPDALEPVSLDKILATVSKAEPKLNALVRGFVKQFRPSSKAESPD